MPLFSGKKLIKIGVKQSCTYVRIKLSSFCEKNVPKLQLLFSQKIGTLTAISQKERQI